MEKRLIYFALISGLFFVLWAQYFGPQPQPQPEAADPAGEPAVVDPGVRDAPPASPAPAVVPPLDDMAAAADVPAREVVVRSPLYEYRLTTRGAGFTGAELLEYESYVLAGERVQLIPQSAAPVFSHRVAIGGDTLDFARLSFQPSADVLSLTAEGGPQTLRFTSGGAVRVEVEYTFRPDDYRVDVAGRIAGMPAGAVLLTEIGNGLAPHDARDHGSERELAAIGWDANRIRRIQLRKVREDEAIAGPLVWAGVKDRYFLIALINDDATRFQRLNVVNQPDETFTVDGEERTTPRARLFTAAPLAADGAFRFEAYLGPQEHGRLSAVGHELQEVNPYGYAWLRPVVRPIAAAILWVLNEMHFGLGIAYGWVLIIFGVMMRIILWPLNARAMRAQMKNMAVQPEMQRRMKEIQAKYKSDPPAQQRAIMDMYKELGVSPFSMMSGCLPLLIPMPVLITLFFVFQSAIEFRGTSFAWLPDLSLRDPLYLLPFLLVVTMFGLQWVSTKMSGMESNPQMKMMMYMMPAMMGFFFWFMPSGLNLYYTSQNLASFPQQILIARERKKATDEQKAKDAAKEKAAAKPGMRGGTHRVKRARKKG
jgi:YidC/Oxa1 family membrane protein insertase